MSSLKNLPVQKFSTRTPYIEDILVYDTYDERWRIVWKDHEDISGVWYSDYTRFADDEEKDRIFLLDRNRFSHMVRLSNHLPKE